MKDRFKAYYPLINDNLWYVNQDVLIGKVDKAGKDAVLECGWWCIVEFGAGPCVSVNRLPTGRSHPLLPSSGLTP